MLIAIDGKPCCVDGKPCCHDEFHSAMLYAMLIEMSFCVKSHTLCVCDAGGIVISPESLCLRFQVISGEWSQMLSVGIRRARDCGLQSVVTCHAI